MQRLQTGLILALRASPGLAPAVLDLLAGRGEPILALVRGDAQRIVGREVEAMRDHAEAAGAVSPTESARAEHLAEAEAEAEADAESEADPGPDLGAESGADLDLDLATIPVQEDT